MVSPSTTSTMSSSSSVHYSRMQGSSHSSDTRKTIQVYYAYAEGAYPGYDALIYHLETVPESKEISEHFVFDLDVLMMLKKSMMIKVMKTMIVKLTILEDRIECLR